MPLLPILDLSFNYSVHVLLDAEVKELDALKVGVIRQHCDESVLSWVDGSAVQLIQPFLKLFSLFLVFTFLLLDIISLSLQVLDNLLNRSMHIAHGALCPMALSHAFFLQLIQLFLCTAYCRLEPKILSFLCDCLLFLGNLRRTTALFNLVFFFSGHIIVNCLHFQINILFQE